MLTHLGKDSHRMCFRIEHMRIQNVNLGIWILQQVSVGRENVQWGVSRPSKHYTHRSQLRYIASTQHGTTPQQHVISLTSI